MNRWFSTRLTLTSMGAATLLVAATVIGVNVNPQIAVAEPIEIAQVSGRVGMLASDEKATEGEVKIVEEEGKRYLVFDETFRTGRGPDVFVLLHRQEVPESYAPTNYVNLGRIQKFNGAQRYEIPANVDVSAFQSVSIWCRQFNATFGYATLVG